ncbi:phage tail tape measure protein [Desulforamulus aeronauticus]|uniref:Phage tail tape measure protein, TP901 family, core region n=1 Tax=Desulforamulus aeronauticus DSM 10349 TaxID=1121421 RepID=A0A1M6SC90_9FIRM|nr:phage tail tape measure protein [Desulforamulus aeronauticus]SHK42325.1 phage tail tape measure protein, TP901 family, core region [Desulforamulus aeronauticus DSM 10349]
MASVIDLATYSYNLILNDNDFTSRMQNAEGNVDRFEGRMGNFTTFLKGAVIAGIATVGIALGGMAIKGIKSADELQQSLNLLAAQTGATTDEMQQLEESLTNIYANNRGESFEDIAQSMARVNQTLGLTGQELENTTQTALMMRDTFDMDVGESIDTVNALMANFGVTAEQAYNLMAQGAQQGANKNGDLTEVLKEYAPHFSQLGISAEEFTDTLIQGAKSGAFQIDKVGDAIKEFSIRSKDMSTTSAEGFELLGLNAEEMFNTFAQGGEGAEKAFQDVITRLGQMDNPLAQNTAGVALFGTMFEDLGIEGIKALGDIGDYAKLDVDALNQINSVRYDSFGQALTGIGRGLETSILIPMGQQVLPIMSDFANWIQANMPQIKAIIGGTLNFIGSLFTTVGSLIGAFIGILQYCYIQNKEIFDGIGQVIRTAFDIITGIFKTATALLKGDWDKFGKELSNLTSNIFKLIQNLFNLGLTTIKTILSNSISNFQSLGSSIMNALYNAFRGVWSSITSWLNSAISSAVSSVKGFSSSFYSAGSQLFSSFWNGIRSVWDSISSWISSKVNWVKNQLSSWRSAQSEMSDDGGGSDKYPAYAQGTPFVPTTGLALLHAGEAVIPKEYNVFAKGGKIGRDTVSQNIEIPNVNITFNVKDAFDISKNGKKIANYVYGDIIKGLKMRGVSRPL